MNTLLLRKLWNDIGRTPGQFLLMATAVFVSVFALTTLANSLGMLNDSTRAAYLGTNPAQATIETEGDRELPTQAELKAWLAASLPADTDPAARAVLRAGVQSERRASLVGRIDDQAGHWFPLVLFVIEDFGDYRIGKAAADTGEWPPATGTMLLERTAMSLTERAAGQSASIILPGLPRTAIRLSGTAHDPGLAPAWQERTAYGYISRATASQLFGKSFPLDELKLVFPAADAGAPELRALANQLALVLQSRGCTIHEIQVPPPRTHPHQSQLNTIIAIFLAFSLLALALSGVLLATLVRSLLQRETRLIGIMKTLGGSPAALVSHYLGLALLPALAGCLIAVPLGLLSACNLVGLFVSMLNLGSPKLVLSPLLILLPLAAGLAIPAALALIPVLQASRRTIREALAGPLAPPPRTSRSRLRLPRLLAMALRNLGRRRAQLILNLGLLGLAGALLISAINIAASYRATFAQAGLGRHYDLDLRLDAGVDQAAALAALRAVKGVSQAEAWTRQGVYPAGQWQFPVTGTYPDKGHGSFLLRGRPAKASLIDLAATSGSLEELDAWTPAGGTVPGSPGAVPTDAGTVPAHDPAGVNPAGVSTVPPAGSARSRPVPQALPAAGAAGQDLIPIALNQNAAAYLPPLRVGDRAELLVNGQRTAFRVAALVREIGPACAWIPQAALDRVPGSSARIANAFFIRLEPGLAATPAGRAAYAACESALLPLGAKIELALPQAEFDSALGGHIWTLIYALGFMALIIAIVGLLGLAAAMGSSVLERTREIAVMRSIGGTPATIRGLVLGEAGLQALLGLVLALALSLPLSLVLGNLIGMMSFKIPLQTTVDPAGILIWTAILVVGGLAASLLAAGRAAAGSVHAALAYE